MSDSEEQSVKSPEDEGGELTQKQKDEKALAALSTVVSRDRDDAVSARKASGIETIWDEDEEYYQGIDDNNRAHEQFTKSQSVDGGLRSTGSSTDDDGGECTAFFNITRQFVDSGAARMGDILLPAGEWNFNLKATPIAGIESVEESEQPVNDEEGNPLPNPDGSEKPYTMGDFAKQEQEDAEETVEKAEVRIKDWLVSCKYSKESRKVIERSARIGTGVLRMFQRVSKARAVVEGKLIIDEKVIPGSKEVDPRNLFPAPDCGDNIHNGSFLLERDLMTAGQVRDLKKLPGFIAENIDKVLKEGANGKYVDGKLAPEDDPERGKKFEIWYYFGEVKREELCACGVDFDKREETEESDDADGIENVDSDNDDVVDGENDHDPIPAVIVLINNTVIKGFLNADSTGEFPYDLMPWQCRDNSPWGIGVSRQARVGQDMLNASARTLMKNAGLSSAPQLIIGYGIRPQNGSWELEKGKIWIADEDAEIDVRKAILAIEIPSMQVELANMIEMASKFVEDATGISFLLQGQQGSAPDTFGGTQIMHNNASALLRRISRIYDENITVPHIGRYYDWLLVHGEDDEKGDLEVEAIGSSALVEREIQAQQAWQIFTMSLNPASGLSPEKTAKEVLRSSKLNPNLFEQTEEEKKQASQPPQDSAVTVAGMNNESRERIASQSDATKQLAITEDTDKDLMHAQAIESRTENEFAARREELILKRELAMMDYANRHNMTLEQVKGKLAETAMKIRSTKELVAMNATADQLPKPEVEPDGKAPAGESYTK